MMQSFPKLDLTFTADGGHPILADASFRLTERSAASRKLVIDPPRGKYFRAVCILMLLAKYRGEGFADKDGMIWLHDRTDRRSWIKALGTSFGKGVQQDFFQTYFPGCNFLSASRGSGHNKKSKKLGTLASAKYLTRLLSLQNLRFFREAQNSPGSDPILLTGEELALFAERLERHETRQPEGWQPIVAEIIAETKRDRPPRPPEPEPDGETTPVDPPQPAYDSQSVKFSARWRELNQEARRRIEAAQKKYDWYVVSSIPSFVLEWKKILCDAVLNYSANVKLVYQSPDAVKNCAAIRAQLLMYNSRRKKNAAVAMDYMLKRLEELKVEMNGWVMEAKAVRGKEPAEGGFQFFESRINHPFTGILGVPAGSRKPSMQTAPPGSFCVLHLFSLYQADGGERCCLYLNDGSPMLNVYYKGILDFFAHGPADGYLKAVNLAKRRSRQTAV
jgi:hypothetical protein